MNEGILYVKRGALQVGVEDLRVWELITDVPSLQNLWSYICLVLNIVLPGSGTILSGCLGDAHMNKTQIIVGLFQFLTSIYIIGWILSIYWGYLLVKHSQGNHSELKSLIG